MSPTGLSSSSWSPAPLVSSYAPSLSGSCTSSTIRRFVRCSSYQVSQEEYFQFHPAHLIVQETEKEKENL